jgi:hypothetical protein
MCLIDNMDRIYSILLTVSREMCTWSRFSEVFRRTN